MTDDVIYAFILISCILLGFVVRHIVISPSWRRVVVTSLGMAMVVSVCGWSGLHSVVTVCVSATIIRFTDQRRCHILTFCFCFTYLAFFQLSPMLDFRPLTGHDNALQMLLVLKLVGMAYEVSDSTRKQQLTTKSQDAAGQMITNKHRNSFSNPSFVDIVCYSYCFTGLFTGPYFTFQTYNDLIHSGGIYRHFNVLSHLRSHYFKPLAISCLTYVVLARFFNIQYVRTVAFYSVEPYWYQVFYLVPMFALFRLRLYIAFIAAECACVTIGLGGYPVSTKPRLCLGPSNDVDDKATDDERCRCDFTTIENTDVVRCEMAITLQSTIKSWNKTIQFWMSNYVYKRLPFKSNTVRMTMTMLLSAYWHGLYGGYYLTFLSTSIYLFVEYQLLLILRSRGKSQPPAGSLQWLLMLIIRHCACMYLGVGFELKYFEDSITYWENVYFAGHVALATAFLVCIALERHRQSGSSAVKPRRPPQE